MWEKLSAKYDDKINMVKVEKSQDPQMMEDYGIESFPTIILEKKKQIKFDDERSEENFNDFLKKNKVI